MEEKIKINFLIVSRYRGNVVKQSSVYIHAKDRKTAEKRAYLMLKSNNSPNSGDIILIDSKERFCA